MKFQPKSEEQVKRLFDKGDYPFTVTSANEKQSRTGNPMLELDLQLEHSTIKGKTGFVKAYLLTDNPNFEFLLRHFCYSIGVGADYERGDINPKALVGKKGVARVSIEIDESGKYPDKNKVVDFLGEPFASSTPKKDLDDDIPF